MSSLDEIEARAGLLATTDDRPLYVVLPHRDISALLKVARAAQELDAAVQWTTDYLFTGSVPPHLMARLHKALEELKQGGSGSYDHDPDPRAPGGIGYDGGPGPGPGE